MNLAHFGTAHFENPIALCKVQNEIGDFGRAGEKPVRAEGEAILERWKRKNGKVLRVKRDALYFAPLDRGVEQPGSSSGS